MLDKLKKSIKRQLATRKKKGYEFYRRFHTPLDLRKIDRRICIDQQYRYVYFRIPKAANSTVVNTLYFAATGEEFVRQADVEDYKLNGFLHPTDIDNDTVDQISGGFTKFTFCRHPLTRFVSAYKDKILRDPQTSHNVLVRKKMGLSENTIISMEMFLDYVEQDGLYDNAHWARQVDLIPMKVNELDFVGQVENIDADLKTLITMIFGKSVDVKTFRPHQTSANKSIAEIDPASLKRIQTIYSADYDSFGYDRE